MWRALRIWTRPPLMSRPPLPWPLSQAIGARPTIRAIAVTVPTPGMDVRMASRLARRGSAAIWHSILFAEVRDRRLGRAEPALDLERRRPSPGRAELVEQGSSRGEHGWAAARRSWKLSMSSLGGAVASGSRLSPRIASIRQSTRSVLAKAPAALANSRERNGLTMATAKLASGAGCVKTLNLL